MKRYILHILILSFAFLINSSAWGQTSISGTWAGGALTGKYKLTGNTNLTGTISVKSGTLEIDLNGYTLTKKNGGFVATVSGGLTLVIRDTQGGGVITGGRGDRGGCVLISGTVKFEGGTIKNCIATDDNFTQPDGQDDQHILTQGSGGAFFINSGGVLEMSGNATIDGCSTSSLTTGKYGRGGAVYVAGTFNMKGGTIKNCQANLGGAVFVHGGYMNIKDAGKEDYKDTRIGLFQMSGGTIESCNANTHGSGVYTNGNVEISGDATITKNKPISWTELTNYEGYPKVQPGGGYGSAIYADGKEAKVTMSGGTLSHNLSGSGGAVMLWTESEMTMTGGTMEYNHAIGTPTLGNGGAVYLQGSTFNFNGGTLRYNTANRYGGAINTNQTATLNLGGNCIIQNNKASHGGGISQEAGECTMVLSHTEIDINGNEAHGHQVNYNNETKQYSLTTDVLGNGGGLFIERGTLTISGGKIRNNIATGHGGGASLYVKRIHGGTTTATISGGEITGNSAEYGGGIDLFADYEIVDGAKNNLVVQFSNGTLKDNNASKNGAGIYMSFNEANSTATMTVGSTSTTPIVTGNTAQASGGGLGMSNNGTFNIINATMSNNSAENGGAIWLGSGKFTIDNGTFNNNTGTNNGGAIYVGSGTFTVNNTITLKANKATNKNGGAIYLGGGTFTVGDSGSINLGGTSNTEGNSAGNNGGGIYCNAGFTVNGTATIQHNSAKNGAGVYVDGTTNNVKFAKQVNLLDNSATNNGGALYVKGGTISMVSNNMSRNSATNGGAIYATGNVTITGNSTMNQNTAIADGGVAYVNGGNITVSGNNTELALSQNSAVNGGAFYVNNGSIATATTNAQGEITGGIKTSTIKGNYTTGEGGAFYVNGGNITLSKTEISGNGYNGSSVSTTNGGAIALYNGMFTFADGSEIKNNAASGNGGALYVNNTGNELAISCTGGSYIGNQASLGGGIYAAGKIKLTFGADVLNNTAKNGGGVYLNLDNPTNGYSMTVTHGLIVGNKAEGENNEGVGGGIYLNQGSLKFTNPTAFGTYNNAASYEAADIYASGNNTTLYLPHPDLMQLSGFDIPGSALYWVYDAHENTINDKQYGRYEEMLLAMDPERPIQNMMLPFNSVETEGEKKVINEICLDLGYDLVYVTLTVEGLDDTDAAAINMIYYHKTKKEYIVYRKALYQGKKELAKVIGLPSGYWIFEATEWSDDKYTETYSPAHEQTNPDDTETTPKKYISIKNDNTGVSAVKVIFKTTKDDNITTTKYVKSYSTTKVNVM